MAGARGRYRATPQAFAWSESICEMTRTYLRGWAAGWWKGAVTLGEFLMGEVLTGKQPPHEIRRHLNLGGRR